MRLRNPWPSNSRSNWNLEMLIFVEGGKPENPEKNPRGKDENQQQTLPTYMYDTGSRIRTRGGATLVGGKRDHYCAIPALLNLKIKLKDKLKRNSASVRHVKN